MDTSSFGGRGVVTAPARTLWPETRRGGAGPSIGRIPLLLLVAVFSVAIDVREARAEGGGPHRRIWTVGVDDGTGPAGRVQPVVGFRSDTNELLVFGGMSGAVAFNDVWAFGIDTGAWRRIAAPCSGTGCPVVVGGEKLALDPLGGGITVLANPAGPARNDWAWSLEAGTWKSLAESYELHATRDCDGDGMTELAWGARCGAGGDGFPSYGVMRCDPAADALACRVPSAPAALLAEHRTPGIQALVAAREHVGVVKEREVQWNRLLADGSLELIRTIRLTRPANDAALSGDYVLVADRNGLTVYSITDGNEAAQLPTCGKARRVFVDGRRAYVLGLRSILVLDILDPAASAVLQDLRVVATPGGSAWASPSNRCSWVYSAADLVCDASGFCPWFGRVAADEEGHRLFLNLLGNTYVADFRGGLVPTFSPAVRTGLVTALRAESARFYVNRGCGDQSIYAEEQGEWIYAGAHDVPAWVKGTLGTGAFSLAKGPARLYVAERQ